MKQKSSLDVAKFLCAIMILIIHTDPFGSYSKLISFGFRNVICVIAVPFFFATSGYLLSEKLNSLQLPARKGYIAKYVKRLLVIYLFWSAVYFPFVVVKWLRAGFEPAFVLEYVKDFLFEGSYSTIWFLPALLSAAGIYYLLRRCLSSKQIFIIGCGVYVVTLLLSSYYGITARVPVLSRLGALYYAVFDSVKNGVLFGLVFVALGAMVQERGFETITGKKAFWGVILGYGLLCVEVVGYKLIGNTRGIDTVASLLPLTFFALLFVLRFSLEPSEKCLTLRKYSMLIFLMQRLPLTVLDMFFPETVIVNNSLLYCLTVTAATFLLSFCVLKLSEKVKWLKNVY